MRLIKILLFISLVSTVTIYLFPRTWELDLIAQLQETKTDFLIGFFRIFSDSTIKSTISVGIPVILILVSFARNNRALREKAILILFSLAVAGMLSVGIKKLVREPRPYEVDTRISQLGEGGGFGFPSGHTLEAVAAAVAFSFFWPEWYVIAASVCWVLLTMMSRIYLGVHDPGDVMGGMFVGLFSFLIVLNIRDYLKRSRAGAPAK